MLDEINNLLAASPVPGAEEYAIHDNEGFDGYSLGEYTRLESAHEIAEFIAEFPDFGGALLNHCDDLAEARRAAEVNYCGCHASLADYAQELTEECTEIPANLVHYIDYEVMGREMELNGDVFTVETGYRQVHHF